MALRTCTRCNTAKPLTSFHIYNGRTLTQCKECLRQRQKAYRRRKPESEEKRRKRYMKESLGSGMRHRVGLKYVLDMPTDTHGKCTKCKQWKTLDNFRKDNSQPTSRPNYYRTICVSCDRKRHPLKIRAPEKYPISCPTCGNRFTRKKGMRQHHIIIHKITLPKPQKRQKTPQEIERGKITLKGKQFLYQYFLGDGCCFYCWKIEPWKLNRHHIWGRKSNPFSITLCENHHALISRHVPFLLGDWY